MAVSPSFRPVSLVDTIRGYLTPDFVRHASTMVGESESSTSTAMHSAVPALLGGMLNFSSSHEGANALAGMARDGGYGAAADNPLSLFSRGSSTSSMMSVGQSMIGNLFGKKSSSVNDAIASSSGVKASSAGTLMSLLAPVALGSVWKMAGPQGQSGAGIANLLRAQENEIAQATPSGLSHILGFGGRPVAAPPPTAIYQHEERDTVSAPSRLYEERKTTSGMRWLPLLLIGLLALGLLAYLISRTRGPAASAVDATRAAVENITLPGGGSLSLPRGSLNYKLANYLASGAPAPQTFVFDHLNFDSATTQLTADSGQTVNDLAAILKAYPNAQIQLAGHTDNTGTPEANQQLSLDRANAVKAMLVNSGIDGNRISTAGYGQERPIASNDSDAGRAQNRRTELTVTGK